MKTTEIREEDIEKYIGMCKFSDCTHINEPGCRIIEAIDNAKIGRKRFEQYLKLQKGYRFLQRMDGKK